MAVNTLHGTGNSTGSWGADVFAGAWTNRSYADLAVHILGATDFPRTPVSSLDLGFDNDALGLGWPSSWSGGRSNSLSTTSLSGLTSLKLMFGVKEIRDLYDQSNDVGVALGDLELLLGTAIHLQEFALAFIDLAHESSALDQAYLFKVITNCAVWSNLRKLKISRLSNPEDILNFARRFQDSLTYISLSDISTDGPDPWPKTLRAFSQFPCLQQASMKELRCEFFCEVFGHRLFYLYHCTIDAVHITNNVVNELEALAADLEEEFEESAALQYGRNEAENSRSNEDEHVDDGNALNSDGHGDEHFD